MASACVHVLAHAVTMHEADPGWGDPDQIGIICRYWICRSASHSDHWFGTQFSIEAGVVAPAGDPLEVHQGTDFAQV